MLSLRRGGVARRLRVLTEHARRTVADRVDMREKAAALGTIRAALAASGIAPEGNRGIRDFAPAERALVRLADSPALQQADADFMAADAHYAAHRTLRDKVAERIPRFLGQPPPDPGAGSWSWYAWSLAMLNGGGADRSA